MYAEGIPVYSPLRVVDDNMKEKEERVPVEASIEQCSHSIGAMVSHDGRAEAVCLL